MNQEAVTFMNWLGLLLLLPATLILAWKVVTEKLRNKRISPDVLPGALLLLSAIIGITELNISDSGSRLDWALLVVQLIVLVLLYRRLWPLLKQRLRD
ncbi:MAG TPA: hypothetical protein VJ372_01720 [Pyrinomonadaceae bacterium]|jgi:hypothetical protein|nr:hypothetical protein [Pyrinomonadaceae bacterium]